VLPLLVVPVRVVAAALVVAFPEVEPVSPQTGPTPSKPKPQTPEQQTEQSLVPIGWPLGMHPEPPPPNPVDPLLPAEVPAVVADAIEPGPGLVVPPPPVALLELGVGCPPAQAVARAVSQTQRLRGFRTG
jgi:hypothetical protein